MKQWHFQLLSCLAIVTISSSCKVGSSDVPLNSQYHSVSENLNSPYQEILRALTALDNKNKNKSRKNRNQDSSIKLEFVSNDLLLTDQSLTVEHSLEIAKSANRTCLITLRYPQIRGLSDESKQATINQEMRELIKNSSSFFSTIQENEDCIVESELDTRHLEFLPCVVEFSKGDLISLACRSILAGRSAYPIVHTVGINLNLRTGEFYQFDDLFDQQSAYRERVAQLLLEQGSWSDIDVEILSNSEIEKDFYLRSDCSDFFIQSVCFVIPTNFSSEPSRGVILFIDIEDIRDILSEQASNSLLE